MTTDTTREALAPCPFCGNTNPKFERMGTARQSCIVVCGNCGCRHESSDEGARNGSSWNDRAALSSQPPAPSWQPIETAPHESGLYLTMIGEQRHIARFNAGTVTAKWWLPYGMPLPLVTKPTHWMPLPSAPSTEGAKP